MRPIDADSMIKRLQEWNTEDAMDKALYNFCLCRILEQPTIEMKQMEWIDDGCITKCSNCGEPREFPHWSYCPNCGLRMKNMNKLIKIIREV